MIPFRDRFVGGSGTTAGTLMAAATLVLIMACVNAAALQLARGAAREREMGIRTALGARRRQLVGQLLAESLLLAAGGGVLGIVLGTYGLRTLGAMAAGELPFWMTFTPRPDALLLCLAGGIATPLLSGLFPAIPTARVSVTGAVHAGGGAAAR